MQITLNEILALNNFVNTLLSYILRRFTVINYAPSIAFLTGQ